MSELISDLWSRQVSTTFNPEKALEDIRGMDQDKYLLGKGGVLTNNYKYSVVHTQINAFTLVELSIVLLIIGLIIGGITAGKSLVREATLRSIITEANNYKTAVNTFQVQFNYLPGDMSNASSFWPSCASPATDCNGDGNSMIEWVNGAGFREGLLAWQHLGLSGIISGNYTGIATDAGNGETSGVNAPPSKYGKSTAWTFGNAANTGATASFPAGITGNYLILGRYFYNNPSIQNIMTPLDTYNIDAKLDDGAPYSGKIVAFDCNSGWCNSYGTMIAPSTCVSGNLYNLTNTSINCTIAFFF